MRTRIPAVLAALFLTVSAAALQAQQDTTRRDTTARDTTKRDTAQAQPAPVAPMPAPAPEAQPAAPASDTSAGVRPGMTEAQVREKWGEPLIVRRRNEWSYMFYSNGHERRLGYYDTVFLQNGVVVDAIVRSADHVYLGVSSSPEGRLPEFTPPAHPAAQDTTRPSAEVGGVRVNTPAPSRPEE